MEITAKGYCNDCETEVGVDFDDESGAPYCLSCGGFELDEIETIEEDDFDDEFGQFNGLSGLDNDDEDPLYFIEDDDF